MDLLKEDISRIKEIMGLDEWLDGYDESCDCYPDDEDVNEGEIDEQEGEGEPAPSGPAMDTWNSGVSRGKANPVGNDTKWETGIERGKGNPVW